MVGKPHEIVWGNGNKVVERKALQWMLEQMGGLQFRHYTLSSAADKKRSASSSALGGGLTEEDQDAGWDFIIQHGERDRGQLKQLRWIHKNISKDGSPIRGWPEKLVQKALDSLANDGFLAKLTTRYDLVLTDFHPLFLDTIFKDVVPHLLDHSLWLIGEPGVGKTPLARTTAMMFSRYWGGPGQYRSASDLDFFRGVFFDTKTPAIYDDGDISGESVKKKKAYADVGDNETMTKERWNAAKFIKHQLRIVVDNDYNATEPFAPDVTSISHEDFVKMVRPSLGYSSDTDTRAMLKRGVFIVFTKDSIYCRPPSQHVVPVNRHRWALRDILLDECKTRFSNYRKGGDPPQCMGDLIAHEEEWLTETLRAHEAKFDIREHYTNDLPVPIVKMESVEFHEAHEGLAAICGGEVLEADSPDAPLPEAPMTPKTKVKQEKFEQDYAGFLLRSHAFSKSLGPNTVLELSPSSATPSATPPRASSHLAPPAASSRDLPPGSAPAFVIPNPDLDLPGDEMDVADDDSEEDHLNLGGSLFQEE